MIKHYKVRHSETVRDYREMYSEFQCDEEDVNKVIEYMRDGYGAATIKERIPSFTYIEQDDWNTYDSEYIDSEDEIEEEYEVEQPVKKNHLPSWY